MDQMCVWGGGGGVPRSKLKLQASIDTVHRVSPGLASTTNLRAFQRSCGVASRLAAPFAQVEVLGLQRMVL
jgi:hypothetical protein